MAKTTPHKAVRIDQDVYDVLIELAKKRHASVTWVINDILRTFVESSEK